jgi:hypothetical protein
VALSDDELEKEVVRLFDIFGQALYLTVKLAVKPAQDGTQIVRNQWKNFARQLIKVAKEDRD